MVGKVHSIESFSKVDGPGIRYVVFMQGCKLRCKFCHNPDTWILSGGKEISEEELIKRILSAKNYLKNGKGGVTFSGGEPLLQMEFLINVCKKLKEHNIHIAIDTAGNFDIQNEMLNELINYVDLFLFDIKHIKDDIHNFLVGTSNKKILEMAKYISNVKKKKMWIRIVYIPNITDKDDSLKEYKKFIKKLKSVEKIEVLPYHEMGKYKWQEMGLKYQLDDIRVPSKEECKKIEKYLTN